MKKKTVAFWNIYDAETKALIQKEKAMTHDAMPIAGILLIGMPGKYHAIGVNVNSNCIKDKLPCYDVYL